MKRVLSCFGAVALAFAAQTASAADMPGPIYKGPPAAVAPIFNWSGFYLGLQAGYGWGRTRHDFFTNPGGAFVISSGNMNYDGFLGGGTLGWNWQAGTVVFGLEGDLSWANLVGGDAICAPQCRTALNWFGTGRGRVGVAMGTMLAYLTGGVAFGDVRLSAAGVYNDHTTSTGWTAGGGGEWAFAPNWSGKIEYLYVDLGTASILYPPPSPFRVDARMRFHIVRAGLNWRF
jgi:outer membrane immunogenic protein